MDYRKAYPEIKKPGQGRAYRKTRMPKRYLLDRWIFEQVGDAGLVVRMTTTKGSSWQMKTKRTPLNPHWPKQQTVLPNCQSGLLDVSNFSDQSWFKSGRQLGMLQEQFSIIGRHFSVWFRADGAISISTPYKIPKKKHNSMTTFAKLTET